MDSDLKKFLDTYAGDIDVPTIKVRTPAGASQEYSINQHANQSDSYNP